jgi:hypothetical protein
MLLEEPVATWRHSAMNSCPHHNAVCNCTVYEEASEGNVGTMKTVLQDIDARR